MVKKYFITFIDDCSKYYYVYLLKSKDEALEMFKLYKKEVENPLNKRIKILRRDRGGEYEYPFEGICAKYGIITRPLLHIHLNKMVSLSIKVEL